MWYEKKKDLFNNFFSDLHLITLSFLMIFCNFFKAALLPECLTIPWTSNNSMNNAKNSQLCVKECLGYCSSKELSVLS